MILFYNSFNGLKTSIQSENVISLSKKIINVLIEVRYFFNKQNLILKNDLIK